MGTHVAYRVKWNDQEGHLMCQGSNPYGAAMARDGGYVSTRPHPLPTHQEV